MTHVSIDALGAYHGEVISEQRLHLLHGLVDELIQGEQDITIGACQQPQQWSHSRYMQQACLAVSIAVARVYNLSTSCAWIHDSLLLGTGNWAADMCV